MKPVSKQEKLRINQLGEMEVDPPSLEESGEEEGEVKGPPPASGKPIRLLLRRLRRPSLSDSDE